VETIEEFKRIAYPLMRVLFLQKEEGLCPGRERERVI
jgi:hypothetical protein